MRVVYKKCAGLDVHKKTVVVCVRCGSKNDVRTFSTVTCELQKMAAWLVSEGVQAIAMESTGVYWKPVWNVLEEIEADWELLLVNAKHVKQVPGRKTDVKDSEWLAELLRHGLLSASRIPERDQRELRDMTRYRRSLIRNRVHEVQRLQKMLEGANIKLDSVISNVTGKSGLAMIRALLAGEKDTKKLASLAHKNIKATPEELSQALEGAIGKAHRLLMEVLLEHIEHLDAQIERMQLEIELQMERMGPFPSDEDGGGHADSLVTHTQAFDPETGELLPESSQGSGITWTRAVELLDGIPGIAQRSAQDVLAEIGLDMEAFPTARHLASWAKVSPGNNESGGKRRSGRTGTGNKWLKTTLVEIAWAAVRKKDSYLKSLFARLSGRRGSNRAIMAVARSILEAIYFMLKRNEPYRDLGGQHHELLRRDHICHKAVRRLEKLGFEVQLVDVAKAACG